ncbi:MAG: septum formation protein Maf [Deltaproteobacteria bacterium RIFCSPLOWO2_12_FULL_40_28]|nr:MAG: septum formation protein Maf [Deltaproteobacteria bacterium RIFCSPHIGHO2_02_FULL_40_28]OGQ18801.1 MAG: septum formation protein Maf [Deltaproteobacteria bacterium RIFCSPHIGHO2_12_FULL_40_32]OGQ40046.1 MAG: septum formation protein Maf [Deltaproteobacteria bacterium RIFCSPLOWO2_02_FULL_40_36]OGQ53229.1 MAG: septum formation protein Maf [Deltaproteobacteria bacterium RIFCSPLOWO2_12_FULL_40_28]
MNDFPRLHSGHIPRLILASASPRRKDILANAGYVFQIALADIDETPHVNENPKKLALRLALDKALFVSKKLKNTLVIGADTLVVLENKIFGKPTTQKEACAFLEALSGKTHTVISAYALILAPTQIISHDYDKASVSFHQLTKLQIKKYVKTGEPMDKAGAYAYQGKGLKFIKEIKGAPETIIGLPVAKLKPHLEKWMKKDHNS